MQDTRRTPVASNIRQRLAFVIAIVLTIALDRATKIWAERALADGRRIELIGDFFGLELTHNPGGAFGLFPGATTVIFALSLAIVIFVVVMVMRTPESPVLFGLVAGGGLGNIVDRIINPPGVFRGRVVDFLDLQFWPTFNIADSAIVIGVALIMLRMGRTREPT